MSAILRSSLGDLPISTGLLRLPLRGNWVGSIELGHDLAPDAGTPASIVFVLEDGTEQAFVGTVRRSGFVPGSQTVTVTVVGGAGALLDEIPPRDHVKGSSQLPAGLIARAIADAAGEVLADGVELALDTLTLPRWTRLRGEARVALDILVTVLGLGWRVLPSGLIWVGVETWPEVSGGADYGDGHPEEGIVIYAPDGASFMPGTTIDGMRAVAVEYQIATGALRCEVRGELAGDPPRVVDLDAYARSYDAKTVKGDTFGALLDLVPEDDELPELRDVPFRVGIPGAQVQIPIGSSVHVQFSSSDPRSAYAVGIDQDEQTSPTPKHVALLGDSVDCGWFAIVPFGPGYALSPVPVGTPGGVPVTGVITGPGAQRVRLV